MTKTDIKKSLTSAIDGALVISVPQVARLMRMRKETAAEICRGCDYEQRGKKRLYYVDDVAERLARRRMK